MHLASGRVITQPKIVPVVMTEMVIRRVEEMAKEQGLTSMIFVDRKHGFLKSCRLSKKFILFRPCSLAISSTRRITILVITTGTIFGRVITRPDARCNTSCPPCRSVIGRKYIASRPLGFVLFSFGLFLCDAITYDPKEYFRCFENSTFLQLNVICGE